MHRDIVLDHNPAVVEMQDDPMIVIAMEDSSWVVIYPSISNNLYPSKNQLPLVQKKAKAESTDERSGNNQIHIILTKTCIRQNHLESEKNLLLCLTIHRPIP
jgi:hypothetical protein